MGSATYDLHEVAARRPDMCGFAAMICKDKPFVLFWKKSLWKVKSFPIWCVLEKGPIAWSLKSKRTAFPRSFETCVSFGPWETSERSGRIHPKQQSICSSQEVSEHAGKQTISCKCSAGACISTFHYDFTWLANKLKIFHFDSECITAICKKSLTNPPVPCLAKHVA